MSKVTQYLEANSHSNQYTEFNVKGPVRNFRLLNFGLANYTSSGTQAVFLPLNAGLGCIIDTISIYANNTLVSQCRNVGNIQAMLNLSQTGSQASALNQTKNNLDFDLTAENIRIDPGDANAYGEVISRTQETTGLINLNLLCPFLLGLSTESHDKLKKLAKNKRRSPQKLKEIIESGNIFNCDLRILIQYTSMPPTEVFPASLITDTYNIARPVLVVDSYPNMPQNKQPVQIVYNEYITDVVNTLRGVSRNEELKNDFVLYSCQNKFIENLYIISNQQSKPNALVCSFQSKAQIAETIDLRLDSNQLVPMTTDSCARKAYALSTVKPNFLSAMGMNSSFSYLDMYVNAGFDFVSVASYFALSINQVCQKELQIRYTRKTSEPDSYPPLQLNVIYQTKRSCLINPDGSVILGE